MYAKNDFMFIFKKFLALANWITIARNMSGHKMPKMFYDVMSDSVQSKMRNEAKTSESDLPLAVWRQRTWN